MASEARASETSVDLSHCCRPGFFLNAHMLQDSRIERDAPRSLGLPNRVECTSCISARTKTFFKIIITLNTKKPVKIPFRKKEVHCQRKSQLQYYRTDIHSEGD